MAVAAVEAMAFRRKRDPETYPCTPSFLVVSRHCNDRSHYMCYTGSLVDITVSER